MDKKKLLNLGLNNGVPESRLTQQEAMALIDENKRRGGRTVTRKSAGEQAAERLQAAREKPPQGTD